MKADSPCHRATTRRMPVLFTKNYKDFEIRKDTSSSELLVSFSGAKKANRCLPGDEVDWEEDRCVLVKRATHENLVGILELKSKYLYGHTSRGNKIFLFHPFDSAYPPMRVGSSERETITNKLIMVQFQDWEHHESMPRANCIRIFGTCGLLSSEITALQWHYGYPQHNKAIFDLPLESIHLRNLDRLILHGTTFHIDPPGCKDVDDVITFRQIGIDQWEIVISIADVAEYIEEGSLADTFAKKKGQTLYQDGVAVVPMIPSHLSEGILSLLPGEEKLAVSLFCEWNGITKTLDLKYFDLTRIEVSKSYTYESIYKATDIPVEVLQDIASSLKGQPTNDSHEWIEELMLLYNRQVAKLLVRENIGLLRAHSPAQQDKLLTYEAIHPDLRMLAFSSATYVPTAPGIVHVGLGSIPYTHASSPLRRYADLVNQRALKAVLREKIHLSSPESLANHLNQQQKKQKHHDRDLFFLQQMIHSNIGKRVAIVVVSSDSTTKVYVPAWKRLVTVKQSPLPKEFYPTQEVYIEYYADLQKPRWEERMVFHLSPRSTT